uniref:Ig-like domain-containing protein n=1 Tax=Astyanax mexicanus TaxID=7994 RepID=A0A8B9JY90_ASTMX
MRALLYSAVVLWLARSADSPSRILITARVGSSAVLPCDCSEIMPSHSPHIKWRTYTELVFERLGEEHYEGEGYEDRVDVPEDKLKKGNCSLVIKNIRPEDAGVYQSYLVVKRSKRSIPTKWEFIQRVELSVEETREELFKGTSPAHNDAGMKFPDVRISILCLLSIILYLR